MDRRLTGQLLSLDGLSWPVNMLQVGARDVETAHHSKHMAFDEIIDDREREQIIFHEQFQRSIQRIIRRKWLNITPHQVFGQDKGLERRCLGGQINLVKCNHSQQAIVAIDHGQQGVQGTAESFNHLGERVLWVQHQNSWPARKKTDSLAPEPKPAAHSFLDGLGKATGFRLAMNRWTAYQKE